MKSGASPLGCPSCKAALSGQQLLEGCEGYWTALGVSRFTCPHCQSATEVQLENGRVTWGYTYAAAAPHFAGMIECRMDGLSVEETDGGVELQLDDHTRRLESS
ncbi:MAG TPA: hypothetical protein VHM70_29755 [Polyangiaceae bacterium]|nr:hypothetical protein [Polyangiaceae bacterium]